MQVPACTEHVLVLPLLLPASQSCCTQAYACVMHGSCMAAQATGMVGSNAYQGSCAVAKTASTPQLKYVCILQGRQQRTEHQQQRTASACLPISQFIGTAARHTGRTTMRSRGKPQNCMHMEHREVCNSPEDCMTEQCSRTAAVSS